MTERTPTTATGAREHPTPNQPTPEQPAPQPPAQQLPGEPDRPAPNGEAADKPRPHRGTRIPARAQIMGWLVLVMAAGLTTVVLLVAEFEHNAIERRADAKLSQETTEFRKFAGRASDGGVLVNDPRTLFRRHLSTQYTDRSELLIGVLADGPNLVPIKQGNELVRSRPLSEATLRGIVTSTQSSGVLRVADGELRWMRVTVLPNSAENSPVGWFVAGYFTDAALLGAQETVRTLILISALALVLGAAVSWLVAGQILAPVRVVRRAAAELTEFDLTHRIPVHGRDDVAALAGQFNAMLDRLQTAFAMRRDFLDDAAHELRTPITIIRGQLEVMGDEPAERAEVVRLCTDELDRMARIVDDLLLLAKAEQPDFVRPEWTFMPELTSDIDAKARQIANRRWSLESVGEQEAWLDPQRVTQAMLQLAQNAVQHTPDGAEIRIGSTVYQGAASFWVSDSGPGISTEEAPRIFDRFVKGAAGTGKRAGAGLGLAIVKAIADAHHGRARVLSEPGRGATFGLELPATPGGALDTETVR